MKNTIPKFDRRSFLKVGAAGAAVAGVAGFPSIVRAQGAKMKIGLMLPYTGTFAPLGVAIENGFRLALQEAGGKFGGREIEFVKVDDESEPPKATDNINRLVTRDKVDLVLGTVHSGVAAGMIRVTRESGVLHIIPNAGLSQAAGALCAPNIFRTSFSNWQSGFAMGTVMAKRPAAKNMVTIAWRYAAGEEFVKGFKDGYLKGSGKIAKELWLPFPGVEFQALLTEIASIKPDGVFAFFAGGGAAKFIKDYQQAGLMKTVPLVGPGFLTEGVLEAVGGAAEGLETALHYGDGLETPKNKAFRLAYAKTFKLQPDVYAVAGYDAGLLLAEGMKAVKGDFGKKADLIKAMEKAKIDSPRGPLTLSKSHNPIHDHYLRKVVGNENRVVGIAVKALDDDPATMVACKMT
ncbi:MAG: twin-arginine translocation signal domain-containing protein [Betaproteobacteria bacterium]|nr:twin-arginine translocation signal domain-containing protein [Betaproteobacteria bacterium]